MSTKGRRSCLFSIAQMLLRDRIENLDDKNVFESHIIPILYHVSFKILFLSKTGLKMTFFVKNDVIFIKF